MMFNAAFKHIAASDKLLGSTQKLRYHAILIEFNNFGIILECISIGGILAHRFGLAAASKAGKHHGNAKKHCNNDIDCSCVFHILLLTFVLSQITAPNQYTAKRAIFQ